MMGSESPLAVPGFFRYPLPIETTEQSEPAVHSTRDRNAETNGFLAPFLDPKKAFPPPVGNPALRGRLLVLANALVSSFPPLAQFLYNNTGFGEISKIPGLDKVEPRFNPIVVPDLSVLSLDDGEAKGREDDILNFTSDSTSASDPFFSIADFHRAYQRKEFTPSDVAEAILALLLDQKVSGSGLDQRHKSLRRAFVHLRPDLVREAAAASTARWQRGNPRGPLDGVPFAVKDELDVRGYPRTCGTKLDFPALTDPVDKKESSWCVQKLIDAGAVMVGITNMQEMGADACNCNPHYGAPPNPYAPGHCYSGGSSGGSACVVGAGLVPFAIGADGGGSIRIPAGFCGLYGLKPSHGRISGRPIVSIANTTGVVGPIAASVRDLGYVYALMSEWDPESGLTEFPITIPRSVPPPGRSLHSQSEPYVLGIYRPWFDSADERVTKLCYGAIDRLVGMGKFRTVDIEIPYVLSGLAAHAITIMNELASSFNLSVREYAAKKGGAEKKSGNGGLDTLTSTTTVETVYGGAPPSQRPLEPILHKNLAPNTRLVMQVAERCPASNLIVAQRVRGVIMNHLAALFRKYSPDSRPGLGHGRQQHRDVSISGRAKSGNPSNLIIVTPTVATPSWPLQESDLWYGLSDTDTTLKVMRYTWLANFSGCPALAAPVGYLDGPGGGKEEEEGKHGNDLGGGGGGESRKAKGKLPISLMGMTEWGNEYAALEFGIALDQVLAQAPEPVSGGLTKAPSAESGSSDSEVLVHPPGDGSAIAGVDAGAKSAGQSATTVVGADRADAQPQAQGQSQSRAQRSHDGHSRAHGRARPALWVDVFALAKERAGKRAGGGGGGVDEGVRREDRFE